LKRLQTLGPRTLGAAPREFLIFLAFLALTAAMTWPLVGRLRSGVVDPGDPYLMGWLLWWDYHQTFTDPLHLFDANIFYPLRYTLAFSENDYGISLLFFPLFAAGFRPLTVLSVATFAGFALSGYGAFRLTRTLTGSTGAAWVAGIVFAFLPYRFHLLSQVHYVHTMWMALTLEALILFVRARTRRHTAWLAAAFVMNGLSCLSWFILSLVPLVLTALYLITSRRLWRDRDLWTRGAAATAGAGLLLLPFLLPYYVVSKTYKFTWDAEMVAKNSASAVHYLVAEYRNKLWKGLGDAIPGNAMHKLFPGLLPLLLALASILLGGRAAAAAAGATHAADEGQGSPASGDAREGAAPDTRGRRWLRRLDYTALAAATVALVAAGVAGSPNWPLGATIFGVVTADRALLVFVLAAAARLLIAYPAPLARLMGEPSLLAQVRASRSGEAFWVGGIWAAVGFLLSLGMNAWLFRILFDFVFLFRSMRVPSRGAMVAYLGLSVLAGLGAARLAEAYARRRGRRRAMVMAFVVISVALLFEFRAAPLDIMRGAVYPDEVTLRLKETPMRGGLVELPGGGGEFPHRYMLRSADHGRPLVNAISTFVPPHASQIDDLTRANPIPVRLLDLMEEIPVSYVVVHTTLLNEEQRMRYENFLARAVATGRLRFVNRFGQGDDLYAVVKTEPEAVSEAPTPFATALRGWDELIAEDPINLLGPYVGWAQATCRLHKAAHGRMPRLSEFMTDVRVLARGVVAGEEGQEPLLMENLSALAENMTGSAPFREAFGGKSSEQYVDALYANAGVTPPGEERASLVAGLETGSETRATVLRKVAWSEEYVRKDQTPSLVLLHYFVYLRRNPDDPPDDASLKGFNFWVAEVEKSGDASRLSRGFASAYEHEGLKK
jgi:hypothetical protein